MSNKQKILAALTEHYTKIINAEELPTEQKGLMIRLNNLLLKPTVTHKELGITDASIKYWASKNYFLLPVLKEVGEWSKFSMLELLWVKMIIQLNQMGCTLDIVMPKIIYAYIHHANPNCTLKYNAAEEIEALDGINTMQVHSFFLHVFSILQRKGKYMLHLFSDDTILFAAESGRKETEVIEAAYETAYKTGITLCISDLVFESMSNTKLGQQFQPATFDEHRLVVTDALNKKGVSEVIIKQTEGKIYQIEAIEKLEVNNLQLPIQSLITNSYQNIEIKKNGSIGVSAKRTTKRNFK